MEADREPGAGRRAFLRTACFAGICACARVPAADAAVTSIQDGRPDPGAPPELARRWIGALLPALAMLEAEEARGVLRQCAQAHFDDLGMASTLAPFRGDLPAFLGFLRSEWGWIVDYDAAAGVVMANENKDHCVCPLVAEEHPDGLGALCSCSEGFAERMFAAVTGGPVRTQVVESILRGGERCRYRVEVTAEE